MKQYYNGNAPDWFNLGKYEILKTLSSKSLCEELTIRQIQLHYLEKINNYKGHPDRLNVFHKSMKDQFKLIRKYGTKKACIDATSERDLNEFDAINITANILGFNPGYDFLQAKGTALEEITSIDVDDYFGLPHSMATLYEDLIHEYEPNDNDLVDKIIDDKHDTLKCVFDGLNENKVLPNINRICNYHEPYKNILSSIREMFKNTNFSDLLPRYDAETIFLKVDINSPDEILHKLLQEHIEKARENSNTLTDKKIISKKEQDKRGGGVKTIKTFIKNRILHYIDLYIWSIEEGILLTNAWYISKIFSDIPRSEPIADSKMNDIIKTHANDWLDDTWLKAFQKFDIEPYEKIFC